MYLASWILFLVNFMKAKKSVKTLANLTLYAAFLLGSLFIATEAATFRLFIPVASLYQALFFFSWSMIFIYLVLSRKLALDTFGLVLVPLVLFLGVFSLVSYKTPVFHPSAYLGDKWFGVHVLGAFFAYASFALSFVGALFYLMQNAELKRKHAGTFYHGLPSLEVLESTVYQTILIGFPLLTVALLSGFVWTWDRYGTLWRWDPKFVFSIVTWLIYFGILYARYISSFHGKRLVLLSIFGFCLVIFTFLGVNFFESGTHNFLR